MDEHRAQNAPFFDVRRADGENDFSGACQRAVVDRFARKHAAEVGERLLERHVAAVHDRLVADGDDVAVTVDDDQIRVVFLCDFLAFPDHVLVGAAGVVQAALGGQLRHVARLVRQLRQPFVHLVLADAPVEEEGQRAHGDEQDGQKQRQQARIKRTEHKATSPRIYSQRSRRS